MKKETETGPQLNSCNPPEDWPLTSRALMHMAALYHSKLSGRTISGWHCCNTAPPTMQYCIALHCSDTPYNPPQDPTQEQPFCCLCFTLSPAGCTLLLLLDQCRYCLVCVDTDSCHWHLLQLSQAADSQVIQDTKGARVLGCLAGLSGEVISSVYVPSWLAIVDIYTYRRTHIRIHIHKHIQPTPATGLWVFTLPDTSSCIAMAAKAGKPNLSRCHSSNNSTQA